MHTTWEKYVPGKRTLSKNNQPRYDAIQSKVQQWIYSWMQPSYVEDEDEYKISKFLLLQFISSASLLSALDGNMFMDIAMMKWLRGYVLVWEVFIFYFTCRRNVEIILRHMLPHMRYDGHGHYPCYYF